MVVRVNSISGNQSYVAHADLNTHLRGTSTPISLYETLTFVSHRFPPFPPKVNDPAFGYTQGVNFLAGILLCYMAEEGTPSACTYVIKMVQCVV